MNNTIFFIIFFILWIGPVFAGVIVAKKKNRSPHWFWFGIWPGVGLWILIIMLILKTLRICEYCKKKIPAGSKVCPYCAKEINTTVKSDEEINKKRNRQKHTTMITVIVTAVVVLGLASLISFSVFSSFKSCEPYKHSIELIEKNSEIKDFLGENYKQRGLISGSISTSGDLTGKASISYKLKGKEGISRVYVVAEKENGIWNYQKIVFYKQSGSSDSINLLSEE
jgi:predicted nucleic acid-binding Zn ribbon protein